MNLHDPMARSLTADRFRTVLHEVGDPARPDYLDDIVAQARHTRQRPAATFPERWLPMSIAVRRAGFPRAAILLAVALLLVGLIAATMSMVGTFRVVAPIGVTNGLIAFESGGDIMTVRSDGSDLRTIVEGAEVGNFSPDGRRLAYWSEVDATWDLVVVDPDGSDPVTIVTDVLEPDGADWSPDGSRIGYAAQTRPFEPGSSRVFIASVDGSGARQIGDEDLRVREPSWSPDGSTLAFGANRPDAPGIWQLYLMDADGTNVRQISDVRGNGFAFVTVDWSHDGSKIVAQAGDAEDIDEWDIWVIDVADGSATDVGAHVGGDEIIPSWAPDRDALAWSHDLIVYLEPGREPVDMPVVGIPVWSPDGQFLATTNAARNLVVIDLSGTVLATLAADVENRPFWQPVFEDR
jgi:dipeptidyl aminopeptidase/acylaminoacyl peptidase